MDRLKSIKVAKSRAGHPLYLAVRDTLREAIEAGIFQPGQRMPSTKQLSEQLKVSLVTAHRALQELVGTGVLQRSQGRGTFVHERFRDRIHAANQVRIGLILHGDISFADFHYCHVLEGIRLAARELAAELILLRFNEDVRNECSGSLLVSPAPDQVSEILKAANGTPLVVVDASCPASSPPVHCVCVDHHHVAKLAVEHLVELGHKTIGFVGAGDRIANGRELWDGFLNACQQHGITVRQQHVVRCQSWRLDAPQQQALMRLLGGAERPTAIFAAGYSFTIDVYRAVAGVHVRIPQELCVVGVDDAPSASYLNPPMTTVRQPLLDLGKASVHLLIDLIQGRVPDAHQHCLPAELIVRESTAAAATMLK